MFSPQNLVFDEVLILDEKFWSVHGGWAGSAQMGMAGEGMCSLDFASWKWTAAISELYSRRAGDVTCMWWAACEMLGLVVDPELGLWLGMWASMSNWPLIWRASFFGNPALGIHRRGCSLLPRCWSLIAGGACTPTSDIWAPAVEVWLCEEGGFVTCSLTVPGEDAEGNHQFHRHVSQEITMWFSRCWSVKGGIYGATWETQMQEITEAG